MSIRPTGEDYTLTREQLLKARAEDEARLRALWAAKQEEADEPTDS